MLLTKEIEVKPNGKMIQYYKNKGYNAKYNQPLIVKIEDLPNNSNLKVEVLCDYCNEQIVTVRYSDYNRRTKDVDKIACLGCCRKKAEETNLLRYGVKNYAQTKECHDKMEETMKSRYGVKYAFQRKEFYDVYKNTCIEKYGDDYRNVFAKKAQSTFYKNSGYINPAKSPDIKKKMAKTFIDKYGVNNPFKSTEIKEKIKNTFIDRYGCENPNQAPEVRQKIAQTLFKNSSQKTSKQQNYICDLYNGILNYPIKYYTVDIYLPDDNLTIEYDGGGHSLGVLLGDLTQEEFDRKEIIRNNTVKREGYKQMRIISSRDLLPSDQVLLQMLSCAREYFSNYPDHSWIEFNIDLFVLRNAEHKNGILYDYGELRAIKEVA